MNNNRSLDSRRWRWAALALVCAAGGACSDDETVSGVDYYYEDPYLYDYYYTADLAYTGYYWSDPWDYGVYVYQNGGEVPGGPTTTFGSVLRMLARGEQVCPGQVTVTPRTAPPACSTGAAGDVRSGATIVFNGCQLAGGTTINGTFDVKAMRSASQASCSSTTSVTLVATNTVTNLSITGPNGARLVIPNQTDSITGTFTYGSTPGTVSDQSSGRLQVYNAAGTLVGDHNYQGTRSIVYTASTRSYAVSGTINVQDQQSDATASIQGTDVTRSTACCRPTGGTIVVNRVGGARPGTHTWNFGASCGQATLDGTTITLPACQ
jgi:hypothetical protein